jgi:hypothetical protein
VRSITGSGSGTPNQFYRRRRGTLLSAAAAYYCTIHVTFVTLEQLDAARVQVQGYHMISSFSFNSHNVLFSASFEKKTVHYSDYSYTLKTKLYSLGNILSNYNAP